jgi:hypothetical protein
VTQCTPNCDIKGLADLGLVPDVLRAIERDNAVRPLR